MKKTKAKTPNQSLLSSLPQELTTVTTVSKLLAVIVFITLPFIGFLIGIRYDQFVQNIRYQEIFNPVSKSPGVTQPMACTADALACPDGSFVGRTGPHCEFQACPGSK